VQLNATTVTDLQRLIDYLNGIVASGGATTGNGGGSGSRIPFSFYGWP
jgi:hypothetical protein